MYIYIYIYIIYIDLGLSNKKLRMVNLSGFSV